MEPWERLDLAGDVEARALLTACCGSTRWVDAMAARRPFGRLDRLLASAREVWWALAPDDWKEAFHGHPRIGERQMEKFASTRSYSEKEQAGVTGAGHEVLNALAEGNRAYEDKFGYTFIVCASGRSAPEMLDALRERLRSDPAGELRQAAEEQSKITALRLKALR